MRCLVAIALAGCAIAPALAWEPPDFESLRERQRARDSSREQSLRASLATAQQELRQLRASMRADEERTGQLQLKLAALQTQAQRRQAALAAQRGGAVDLYTVARQAAGDLAATMRRSPTAPPGPRFDEAQRATAANPRPLALDDLAALWEALHTALTHTATRSQETFQVQVAPAELHSRNVVRVGTSFALADGQPARYDPIAGTYRLLETNHAPATFAFAGAVNVPVPIGEGVVARPNPADTLRRSGPIGVLIALLGIAGVALLATRAGIVIRTRRAERRKRPNSPTARLAAARDLHDAELTESLAGWVNAAVAGEMRRLLWGHAALQVIIAAAPLLGLLGTVTGMIVMFDQLRIYGSGDPVLMADGIAQALATTWLGLIVALPLLLGHRWVAAVADGVITELDRAAIGFVADTRPTL